jgi:hypothetical protein
MLSFLRMAGGLSLYMTAKPCGCGMLLTGVQQALLRGHEATGVIARFSPDGRRVITADPTGTLFEHPVTLEDSIALARTRTTRALTCEERVQFLQDQAVCPTPTPTPTP